MPESFRLLSHLFMFPKSCQVHESVFGHSRSGLILEKGPTAQQDTTPEPPTMSCGFLFFDFFHTLKDSSKGNLTIIDGQILVVFAGVTQP